MLEDLFGEARAKVDPWMAFRLLCYLVAIWKSYRAQHPRAKRLPAILPIVVHHSRTGWTAPVAFEQLLDVDAELLDALGPHVPRFRFLLDDLAVQTDADLRARRRMTAGGRVAILSLKHGRDPLGVRIRMLAPDGRAPAARDVLASILRYILETNPVEPATLRVLLARQVGRETVEEIMTGAERLRREGRRRASAKRCSSCFASASGASPRRLLPASTRRRPPTWTSGSVGCSRRHPSMRCWRARSRCRPARQCRRRVRSLAVRDRANAADCQIVQRAGVVPSCTRSRPSR